MPSISDNTNGWTTVTKSDKKRIAKKSRKRNTKSQLVVDHNPTLTVNQIKTSLASVQEELCFTDFFSLIAQEKAKLGRDYFDHVVCYGVGNFSKGRRSSPLYQLAFILSIANESSRIQYFDPCTTETELDLLQGLTNIDLIANNERGFRSVEQETLFFMPHCPAQLYNNVLLANWANLDKVVIFGNSLSAYETRSINKLPTGIELLLPFIEEIGCAVSKRDTQNADGDLEAAFNDCFLMRIKIPSREELPEKPNREDNGSDGEIM